MTETQDKEKSSMTKAKNSSAHQRPIDIVIEKVKNKVRNGEDVNLHQIQQEAGYSKSSAKSYKAKNTDTWDEEIEPFVERLKEQRGRLIDAFSDKDLSDERAKDIAKMIDTFTENIQLLGGKTTKNVTYTIVEGENEQITDVKASGKVRDADIEEKSLEKGTDTTEYNKSS